MTPVFLDTVGLIALWDRLDQWRLAAMAAYHQIVASGRSYVTITLVLLECGDAAARKPCHEVSELR